MNPLEKSGRTEIVGVSTSVTMYKRISSYTHALKFSPYSMAGVVGGVLGPGHAGNVLAAVGGSLVIPAIVVF